MQPKNPSSLSKAVSGDGISLPEQIFTEKNYVPNTVRAAKEHVF